MSKITVIMCTYNRPHLLQRAVDSILAQTFRDWELLIVNDGGTPIAIEYETPPAGIVREINLEHQGQPRILNIGIQMASANLITFLDDDDVAYPNKLELQVQAMEKSKADMIYFPVVVPGHPTMGIFPWEEEMLLDGNCAPNLGVVVRKSAFDKIGLHDERCLVFWDWDWQLRAVHANLRVEQAADKVPVGEYHVYPNSVVRTRGSKAIHDAIHDRATGKRVNELTLVVPSYNYPQYLDRLIGGMYNQTCPNWQLIIVDDASKPDLRAALRDWQRYKNITVKQYRKNKGSCVAIADGIGMVKTKYCAVLDADNFLLPEYVVTMIDYLDSHPNEIGAHCAFAEYIDMKATGVIARKNPITYENSISPVQSPGTMLAAWRTEIAKQILPEFELCPDWDMMLKAVEIGPVGYIDNPLVGWERHTDSRWWWNVEESNTHVARCEAAAIKRRAARLESTY